MKAILTDFQTQLGRILRKEGKLSRGQKTAVKALFSAIEAAQKVF